MVNCKVIEQSPYYQDFLYFFWNCTQKFYVCFFEEVKVKVVLEQKNGRDIIKMLLFCLSEYAKKLRGDSKERYETPNLNTRILMSEGCRYW